MKKIYKVMFVGRTNVGKSTVFNAVIGSRKSIEHHNVGSTRDRIEHVWLSNTDTEVIICDTGGYIYNPSTTLDSFVNVKTEESIDMADLVVWLFDLSCDLTEDDVAILSMLRQKNVRMLFVGNKADVGDFWSYDFYKYGIRDNEIYKIAAVHRRGITNLQTAMLNSLGLNRVSWNDSANDADVEETPLNVEVVNPVVSNKIKISIFGKPNTGKSSFVNFILGYDRVICSDVAGTTRDIVELDIDDRIIMYDMPGFVRKCSNTTDGSNTKLFQVKALAHLKETDICIVMLSVDLDMAKIDKSIIQKCVVLQKPVIVCINKIDLLEDRGKAYIPYVKEVLSNFSGWQGISVIGISAKEGISCWDVYNTALLLVQKSRKRVPTPYLNRCFGNDLSSEKLPNSGKLICKPQYILQVAVSPPTFVFFMNTRQEIPDKYKAFVRDKIIKRFDFLGVPVVLRFKTKTKNIGVKDNVRQNRKH